MALLICALYLVATVHSVVLYEDFPTEKREWTPSAECTRCLVTFDTEACIRCNNNPRSITPYHSAKRSNYMVRRNTGCGCCVLSRLTNTYCCNRCNESKRGVYLN